MNTRVFHTPRAYQRVAYRPYVPQASMPAPVDIDAVSEMRYPLSQTRPVRMSFRERMISILFMGSMIAVLCTLISVFVAVVGFDNMTQLAGAEVIVENFDVGPAPRL